MNRQASSATTHAAGHVRAVHHAASAPARRWRAAVPRLSQFVSEHLLLLPIGAGLALVWVNLWPLSYYEFSYQWAFMVNEVAMTLFFALVAKEVVEATTPGGMLHTWRRTIVPVIAAAGEFLRHDQPKKADDQGNRDHCILLDLETRADEAQLGKEAGQRREPRQGKGRNQEQDGK